MMFPFGRKAKLQKLLKELQVDIVGEALTFTVNVQESFKEVVGREISQMVLNMGALVFLVYVLGRFSARCSESLMNIVFDPTVLDISRLFGKMIGSIKPELAKTYEAEWLNMLNIRSVNYSKATFAGESWYDKNSLFSLAASEIAADVGEADHVGLNEPIKSALLNAIKHLNFEPRLKAMQELL
jgi:hypothetical protein